MGLAYVVGQGGGFLRIGLKGADDVHPVQGMQMIEVNNMVVLVLSAMQQVANDACIGGNGDADSIVDCPHRGHSMGVGSDPAGALNKMMRVPGVPALKNNFDPAKHLPGTPGVDDLAALHFHLDARWPLYSGNRINRYSVTHMILLILFESSVKSDVICMIGYYAFYYPVERRHRIPEIGLAASDARMACLHRPTGAVVEFGHGQLL